MPDWREYVRSQLRPLRIEPSDELSIITELSLQLEQAYSDALRAGKSEGEATEVAKAEITEWDELARDLESSRPRDPRPERMWGGLWGDIHHALRLLSKSPVFTAVAVFTIALFIGGCTAMFSLVDAVLLRPLDYRDPNELVMVWEKNASKGAHRNVVAMADYLDWKQRSRIFRSMSPVSNDIWNATGQGQPVVLKGISVNSEFLPMLGVAPLLGRSFVPQETDAGGAAVAILGHNLWVERYGAREDALGKVIYLDGRPKTIIGVLPANFPWLGRQLDILTPLQLPHRDWRVRAGRFLRVVARRNSGVSLAAANDELNRIAKQLEAEYPAFNSGWGVEVNPLTNEFAAGSETGLWVLMGAVTVLLLIACSNIANLLLARAVVREREIAIRTALGATSFRLIRQLLVESLVLASLGGVLGCAVASLAIRLVQVYGPENIGRLSTAGLTPQVLLFAFPSRSSQE